MQIKILHLLELCVVIVLFAFLTLAFTWSAIIYHAYPATCVSAGGQYIIGTVYDSNSPNANGVPGLRVALGNASGINPWIVIYNFDDGKYAFILAGDGGPYKPAGTYYVWLVDQDGQRISDVGGPINLNPVGPDVPGTCWAGTVNFWKNFVLGEHAYFLPHIVSHNSNSSTYNYYAYPATCVSAGGQYIIGTVYDSNSPNANGVPGLRVALGNASGTNPWIVIYNFDDGKYAFILAGDGGPYKPAGTYYVWLVDQDGQRISDVGGPINLNPVGPDVPGTCWAGTVNFWKK